MNGIRHSLAPVLLMLVLAFPACGRKDPAPDPLVKSQGEAVPPADGEPAPAATGDAQASDDQTTTDSGSVVDVVNSIDQARRLVDAGEVDSAAAGLLRMQIESRSFSAEHAAAYRDALSRAMAAAVAAAEKGDARGEAALQMLRATRRR